LIGLLGFRVSKLALNFLQIPQDFLGATNDEYWLTTPLSNHLLAWLDLAIFTFTGAPAAFALALGNHDPTNGTAAPTAPAAPTTDVAATRKRRRPTFTPSLLIQSSPISFVAC
jgi:hypothetical protein